MARAGTWSQPPFAFGHARRAASHTPRAARESVVATFSYRVCLFLFSDRRSALLSIHSRRRVERRCALAAWIYPETARRSARCPPWPAAHACSERRVLRCHEHSVVVP